MSQKLVDLINQADALTPDEQLQLIAHLTQKLRRCEIKPKPSRKVTEFAGIAPNLLRGMDAQEYVTRIRRGEFPELEIAEVESRKEE
ncbi:MULTISPECIES: hypothetical protein [unclassified Coleofasciculus]|uniref:hypothetical protein n=1 Tax=unclassified Coleofasciculus TaxID=2692782 RepID=UPI0018806DAB|nr:MULTISPECIES: hypothetical protein [unclassified Coleofasciculus]MBE9130065.1 hypothetical protein [Coleofasciculus sp. LEGE 07081]MBE9152317.1 hypothetical protein [Coleofasciculus sp. LEGE 07092]